MDSMKGVDKFLPKLKSLLLDILKLYPILIVMICFIPYLYFQHLDRLDSLYLVTSDYITIIVISISFTIVFMSLALLFSLPSIILMLIPNFINKRAFAKHKKLLPRIAVVLSFVISFLVFINNDDISLIMFITMLFSFSIFLMIYYYPSIFYGKENRWRIDNYIMMSITVWLSSMLMLFPIILISNYTKLSETSINNIIFGTMIVLLTTVSYISCAAYFNSKKKVNNKIIKFLILFIFPFTIVLTHFSPNMLYVLSEKTLAVVGKVDWRVNSYLIDKNKYPASLFSSEYWPDKMELENTNYILVKGVNAISSKDKTLLCPVAIIKEKNKSLILDYSDFLPKEQPNKLKETAKKCYLIDGGSITYWNL